MITREEIEKVIELHKAEKDIEEILKEINEDNEIVCNSDDIVTYFNNINKK